MAGTETRTAADRRVPGSTGRAGLENLGRAPPAPTMHALGREPRIPHRVRGRSPS